MSMIVDHRNVAAALRRLAVPDGLAIGADQLLGIADTIVIGTFGAGALAAISASTSVFITLGIGLFAFGSGVRILGAQAIGAGDPDRFGRIVRAGVIVPLSIALAAALAALFGGKALMSFMLGGLATSNDAAAYLTLRAFSLLPMVITGMIIVAFGTVGEARMSIRALLVINAVHLPLLAVLALGLGSHHPLGIVGAGISSLIAECAGLAYSLWQAARRPQYRLFASLKIDWSLVRASAKLSFPEFVFLTLIVAPDAVTIYLLAPYGAETIAAFRALTVVSDVTWALPGSLGDATQIVIGQRLGARDLAGARAFRRSATRLSVLVCGGVALAVAAGAWPLAALFTLNGELATIAAGPLALHMISLPLKGYGMTMLAPIRAAGDTTFSMWVGIGASAVVFALLYLLITVIHLGLWAVPISWFAAWGTRAIMTALRLRGGDWERRPLAA